MTAAVPLEARAGAAGWQLDDDVDVWVVDLERDEDTHRQLLALLSPDERTRAGRFVFERDRRHYAHCRGLLRRLLGRYLEVDPRDLTFDSGARGKPFLASPRDRSVAFNVSHSGGLGLIALSGRGELGVDIEAHRPLADGDDLADRFFSPGESAALRQLPGSSRTEAFFRCWSRKEAYVKAVGDGLAYPLDAFDVTFAPDAPPVLTVPGDPAATDRWALHALPAPPGYAAALVTEGPRRVNVRTGLSARSMPEGLEESYEHR